VNATLLIHAIVRQTMVLIAMLATTAGRRTPLARIADEVFSSLVQELEAQGVGHKVIADMLGMGLRTYHRRAARLAESDTEEGRSLWEGVLTYIRANGRVPRAEVLTRFPLDNEVVVRSVLRDLVESGIVYQTGRGDATSYRAAEAAELSASQSMAAIEHLLLVAVHQNGPATATELQAILPLEDTVFQGAIGRLSAQGLVTSALVGGEERYESDQVVIPLGAAAGWEAAVFDHYQAMVTALVTKLRVGVPRSSLADKTGGSTFTFDVWSSHPLAGKVLGYLQAMREQGLSLRREIDAHAETDKKPLREPWIRVTAYVGQAVKEDEIEDEDDLEA
jgi:hypothetical protein